MDTKENAMDQFSRQNGREAAPGYPGDQGSQDEQDGTDFSDVLDAELLDEIPEPALEDEMPPKKKASKLILLVPVVVLTLMGAFMALKLMPSEPEPAAQVQFQGGEPASEAETFAPPATPAAPAIPVTPIAVVGAPAAPVAPVAPVAVAAVPAIPIAETPAASVAPVAVAAVPVVPVVEAPAASAAQAQEPAMATPSPDNAGTLDDRLAALEVVAAATSKSIRQLRAERAAMKRPRPVVAARAKVAGSRAPTKARVAKKAVTTVRTDYAVYAVVDGRAWVTDIAKKVNHTVAVGDSLPDGSIVKGLVVSDTTLEVKTSRGSVVSEQRVQRLLAPGN